MTTARVNHLNYNIVEQGAGETALLLHGFTGSAADWESIIDQLSERYCVLAVDIVGHGKTDAPADIERYTMPSIAADLVSLLQELDANPAHLIGYSMGGRLALYLAVHHPDLWRSLTLESASPGLKTAAERKERQARDNQLADRIEREGIAAFVDFWESLPLWESQRNLSDDVLQGQREARLRNNPLGLANSLRGMGTGVQPPLWDALHQLSLPVQLIAGALDHKFVAINQAMHDLISNSRLNIISNAGHNTHLEQPDRFLRVVQRFLWR